MKRILFVLAMCALLLPVTRQARSAEVSVDFFYNNLYGGSWMDVEGYGYCWQPDIAVSDPTWRPYTDGYWAYTDLGWTWVSYEDFGWATYHYGRWAKLADYGWIWVPGADLDWGPAWVSWRTGGDYIGWAPLPPRGPGIVYEGGPIGGRVDIEFDIGPNYYNFCDVRYIGEPVLRSRIVDVAQNVTYINQTVNVTNITYVNKTVYNYGPDINVVNQHSSRPIQRLKIERQENIDVAAAAKSGGITKVQGNALVVAAPARINKPAQQIAPPTVKTRVAQPQIHKGWTGVANEAQIKEKMKTEDLKSVPPATAAGASSAASAAPMASATAAPAFSPVERGKRKGRMGEQASPGMTAPPAGAMTPQAATPGMPEGGKYKGRAGEKVQPGATLAPMESPGARVSPYMPEGKPGRGKRNEEMRTPPVSGPTAGAEGMTTPPPGGARHKNFEETSTPPGQAGSYGPPSGKRRAPDSMTPPPGGAPPTGAGAGEGRRKERAETGQPSGAPAGGEQGKPEAGKKKGEKASPSPGPQ